MVFTGLFWMAFCCTPCLYGQLLQRIHVTAYGRRRGRSGVQGTCTTVFVITAVFYCLWFIFGLGIFALLFLFTFGSCASLQEITSGTCLGLVPPPFPTAMGGWKIHCVVYVAVVVPVFKWHGIPTANNFILTMVVVKRDLLGGQTARPRFEWQPVQQAKCRFFNMLIILIKLIYTPHVSLCLTYNPTFY